MLWLAGVAIFTSLISLYYYLQVLRQMYIERPAHAAGIADDHGHGGHDSHDEPEADVPPLQRPSILLTAAMGVGLVAVVWLGQSTRRRCWG